METPPASSNKPPLLASLPVQQDEAGTLVHADNQETRPRKFFKNKEQVDGFARVLDNLGTAAIVGGIITTTGYGPKVAVWLLFTLLLSGVCSIFAGYFLRRVLPSTLPSPAPDQKSDWA